MRSFPPETALDADPHGAPRLRLWLDPADLPRLRDCERLASGAPAPPTRLRTRYFDTAELALARGGFTLRVRQAGRHCIQTIQGVTDPLPQSRVRVEDPVPSLEPDLERIPSAELRSALREVAGQAPLQPIVEIETLRTEHRVETGASEIQLAIDEGTLRSSRGDAPIAEVVLMLRRGQPEDLYRLALELQRTARLRMATRSASARALTRLTGVAPQPQRARRARLSPDATLEQAVEATFRGCFQQILANEEPVRLGLDAGGVHQMRVGVRRMRSALDLFADSVPEAQRRALKPELRWLARELGRARDLDVFLEGSLAPLRQRIPDDPGLKHLEDEAREMCDRAYDALRVTLDSQRYAELVLQLGGWLAGRGWRDQPLTPEAAALFRPAREKATRLLRRRRRKLRRLGRELETADLEALHRIRIEAKKLRYAAEFLRPLFPDTKTRPFVRATKAVQETLGHLNDTQAASQLLDELLAGIGESDPVGRRAVGFVEGWVARGAEVQLAELPPIWQEFQGVRPFWRADR